MINVNDIIMQMELPVGPALRLNPAMLPSAWPSGSPLQRGVTSNWFAPHPHHMNHPFITSHVEGWRLAKINSSATKKKKGGKKRSFAVTRTRFQICSRELFAWEAALKIFLSYKLAYTSTVGLSETIMKDSGGWRLARLCGWKAGGVLTDAADVLKVTPFI